MVLVPASASVPRNSPRRERLANSGQQSTPVVARVWHASVVIGVTGEEVGGVEHGGHRPRRTSSASPGGPGRPVAWAAVDGRAAGLQERVGGAAVEEDSGEMVDQQVEARRGASAARRSACGRGCGSSASTPALTKWKRIEASSREGATRRVVDGLAVRAGPGERRLSRGLTTCHGICWRRLVGGGFGDLHVECPVGRDEVARVADLGVDGVLELGESHEGSQDRLDPGAVGKVDLREVVHQRAGGSSCTNFVASLGAIRRAVSGGGRDSSGSAG